MIIPNAKEDLQLEFQERGLYIIYHLEVTYIYIYICVYIYIYIYIYTSPSAPSLTLLIKDLNMIYLKNSNSSECLKIDLNLLEACSYFKQDLSRVNNSKSEKSRSYSAVSSSL